MSTYKKAIREQNKQSYTKVIQAFHNAIKYHSGGFELFANHYGRNTSTVRNQFNINHPNQPTFQLLLEAIEYLGGDPVAMNSLCILGNGRYIPDHEVIDSASLDDSVMTLLADAGGMVHECAVALADGVISRAERKSITAKAKALQDTLDSLNAALARAQ